MSGAWIISFFLPERLFGGYEYLAPLEPVFGF